MSEPRGIPDQRWSPTVRRRRLARALADLRSADGRSAADIAKTLGVAESTVTRLEDLRHLTLPKPDLIATLVDIYKADDVARAEIAALVDQARVRDWWHPYKRRLSATEIQYLGLEAEARILRVWDPMVLPNLLQTVDYARAVREASPRRLDQSALDELDAMHTERCRFLLEGPQPVHIHALVGESALRRVVGGSAVMRAQLQHIHDLAGDASVDVQVVRNDAGTLPEARPFTVITFFEALDPEAIHTVSAAGGAHWVTKPDDVVAAETAWETLVGMGSTVKATRELIHEIADQFA